MNARHQADVNERVLEQLQLAHQIILNALAVMTAEQKRLWSQANTKAGMHPEDGIAGSEARLKAIAKATWGQS